MARFDGRQRRAQVCLSRRCVLWSLVLFFVLSYVYLFVLISQSTDPESPKGATHDHDHNHDHPHDHAHDHDHDHDHDHAHDHVNPDDSPNDPKEHSHDHGGSGSLSDNEGPFDAANYDSEDREEDYSYLMKQYGVSEMELDELWGSIDYSDVDRFGDPPQHTQLEWKSQDLQCPTYSSGTPRNYLEKPVVIFHQHVTSNIEFWPECDCPCGYSSRSSHVNLMDGFMCVIPGSDSTSFKSCPHQYKILYSMESATNYPVLSRDSFSTSGYDILATYDLESDVPAAYFSWEEYDFFRPSLKKTQASDMLVMISNCATSNGRLDYISKMVEAGLTMDSYGRCLHNKDIEDNHNAFVASKTAIQARYRFSNVFENSNTKDYVTEKLFGTLASGSVPLHMGIPQGLGKLSPSPKAVISSHDYSGPEEMVKFLKYLSANATAYEEYLEWKKKGVSKEFRAMVDMARVHSWCRLCIRIGDRNRWKYNWEEVFAAQNPYYEENISARDKAPKDSLYLKLRERGKYWFKAIYLSKPFDYNDLLTQITLRFPHKWMEIFEIYVIKRDAAESLRYIQTTQHIEALQEGMELEVVILDQIHKSPSKKWERKRKDAVEKFIAKLKQK